MMKWFAHIGIVFLTVFITLPFLPTFLWSLTKRWPWPSLLPNQWDFSSWTYLFSTSGMAWEGLKNSLAVASVTLILTILLGLPAAKGMAQNQFKGKSLVFCLFLSPLFIPLTVYVFGLHSIAIELGFFHHLLSVSIAHTILCFPYFFAIVWYRYRLLGTTLQEAAFTLGARKRQIFLWIELPHLAPSLLLGSLLVVIISFSQYMPTWIMSGGMLRTLPLVIFPFAQNGDTSLVAVYGIWFFVAILTFVFIYFLLFRWISNKYEGV